MRPLNARARWLILPGLSAAGGLLAGLAFLSGWEIVVVGGLLGLATALATTIAPKAWIAVLLAPVFATLGMAASAWLYWYFPGEPHLALRYVLSPSMQILGLLTTAPNVVLHGVRMKRTPAWFPVGLTLAIAAGVASGFTLNEASGQGSPTQFISFCVILNASGAVALEVALRRSAG